MCISSESIVVPSYVPSMLVVLLMLVMSSAESDSGQHCPEAGKKKTHPLDYKYGVF